MKLDTKTVAALDLAGKRDAIFFDKELPGFGLRLRASGDRVRRSWIAQYRSAGRTRRVLIGSAEKVAPPDARRAARKVLAQVELGGDPQGTKVQTRQEATRSVRSIVDTYLDAKRGELRPVSLRITKLYLTGPYFRSLHPLAIGNVTRADVAAAVRAIVSKHSATTAAAARRALSAFFSWAIAEGLLGNGANPVDGSFSPDGPAARDRPPPTPSSLPSGVVRGRRSRPDRAASDPARQPAPGGWRPAAERARPRRGHVGAAGNSVQEQALAHSHAAGGGMDIIRSVPLSARDHIVGDRAGGGCTNWSTGKQRLDHRLAGVKPWRVHDIRRTVATGMADIGIEPHHIEACLNHFGGHRRGVAGTYNRSGYERAVAAALARWADHVVRLVSGKKPGTVVKLHKRR